MPKTKPTAVPPDGAKVISTILKKAGKRPGAQAETQAKTAYAIKFADLMGGQMAADLMPRLKGISATTKRTASSVGGKTKQLDVNFSTPRLGLALGISLKSVHTRDRKGAQRYTHNMKRNEEELRIEASGYHKRQPYAVMVGVLFLPFDSCTDGKSGPSSFGSWVRHLRPYTGRDEPSDELDRFEKLYVSLYRLDSLEFFDVSWDPPKNGKPERLLSYGQFLDATYHEYLRRNGSEFRWAGGEEEPLDPTDDAVDDDA